MDRVCLLREAVLIQHVLVFHGNEDRDDRDAEFCGVEESARLCGPRLAVVPPHRLLGVNENEVSPAQHGLHSFGQELCRFEIGTQWEGVTMPHEKSRHAGQKEVGAFDDFIESVASGDPVSDLFDGKVNAVVCVGEGKVRIGGMVSQVDNVNRILDRVALYLA